MTTNVTPEMARHELKRRFRDPVTGAKVRGHKLRQTDGRMNRTPAMSLSTADLVEIANPAPAPASVSTPTPQEAIRQQYVLEWDAHDGLRVAA
jgi:hypothetical protein